MLVIPEKAVERSNAGVTTRRRSGDFLRQTGLTVADIREQRLPDIPSGGLAVVSNGLALDLLDVVDSSTPDHASAVVNFIFNVLELKVAAVLLERAVDDTLKYIRENKDYISSCSDAKEVENFLFSPFVLPDSVVEMSLVHEETDQDMFEEEEAECELGSSVPEAHASHQLITDENGGLVAENSLVYGINILNSEGMGTLEISSIQDMMATNSQMTENDFMIEDTPWTGSQVTRFRDLISA